MKRAALPTFLGFALIVGIMTMFYSGSIEVPQQTVEQPSSPVRQQELGHRIVYLQSSAHRVAVYTSQRFDITTVEGTLVASGITQAQFQRDYPDLYDFYRTSYAEAWAGTDTAIQTR